jgi:hypothetical protein
MVSGGIIYASSFIMISLGLQVILGLLPRRFQRLVI